MPYDPFGAERFYDKAIIWLEAKQERGRTALKNRR
jgi:hypothetical protein